MPYAIVCSVDPDDGKIHDPRNSSTRKSTVTKSVCGKIIKSLIRSGEGGKWHTLQRLCVECWPCLRK